MIDNSQPKKYNMLKFRPPTMFNLKKYNWSVEGFDTETENGNIRVVASSTESHNLEDFDSILNFLTMEKHRQQHNFFYNLQYDIESFLKLNEPVARDIALYGRALYTQSYDEESKDFRFTYIPKKLFKIVSGKKTWYYTDVAQFYRSSLKKAAFNHLGLHTHELKSDRGNLFTLHSMDKIKEYCQHDADLTKRLGQLFVNKINKLGLYPRACISSGNLSQIYTRQNTVVPHLYDIPKDVSKAYYSAFRGGWFDCYKRGTFNAYQYDISSAYPSILINLPNLKDGKWINDFGGTLGVVRVAITSSPKDMSPLSLYFQNRVIYPEIDTKTYMWITLKEYETLKQDCHMEVDLVFTFIPNKDNIPPYSHIINTLYQYKQNSAADPGQYQVAKEIINSLYGKTCEKVKQHDGTFKVGMLFNPVYAAEITAGTRMQIYKDFYKYRKNIIAIHTDSVVLTNPVDLPKTSGLGSWDTKNLNENLIILKSGIYQFEGKAPASRGFRKFRPTEDKNKNLEELFNFRDLFNVQTDTITLKPERPRHLKECIIQDKFADISTFETVPYKITLNDIKRYWDNKINVFADLLTQQSQSYPVCYSDLVEISDK